jgi:ferredoxin
MESRTVGVVQPTIRVWIDQDLCTGDGLCVDHAPDVFTLLEDGIAYVVQDGVALCDPGGSASTAAVPSKWVQAVVTAAEFCPGECIFIETVDDAAPPHG